VPELTMKKTLILLALLAAPALAGQPSPCKDEAKIELDEAELNSQLKGLRIKLKDLGPMVSEPGPRLGVMMDTDLPRVDVLGVTPDGPAEHAGIRAGDVLLSLDGVDLGHDGVQTVRKILRAHKPGDVVKVELKREAEQKTVQVTLDDSRLALKIYLDQTQKRELGKPPLWRDLRLAAVNPELGAYFGVSDGVLVLNAPQDGEPPLKAGDVIVRIGDRAPRSPTEAARLLRTYDPGQKIAIEVMRQKQLQTLTVTSP
jgi:S1-C subfamily serine protease